MAHNFNSFSGRKCRVEGWRRMKVLLLRHLLRFFVCLVHPNPYATLATDQKWFFKSSSYLLPKFSRVPLTIVLVSWISTMVNGTLLNFGKRYKDNLRVIFDQWPKLLLGLDALSNQKNLEWYLTAYVLCTLYVRIKTFWKIESVNKAFLFWYWQRLKKNFF